MKKLPLFIVLVIAIPALACVNEYRTKLDGRLVNGDISTFHWDFWIGQYAKEEVKQRISARAQKFWGKYQQTKDVQYLSDYAAQFIYLGQYAKAKKFYQQIEKTNPDLYTTASNLGTLYELTGKPDSALYWIKKSVELNPRSHEGSEWIHIKVLEHKLAGNKALNTSLLDADFGQGNLPVYKSTLPLDSLYTHLSHQLTERVKFVQPPNAIVANLMFDLGNASAIKKDIETAIKCYEVAQKYGFKNKLLEARLSKMRPMTEDATKKNKDEAFPFIDYIGIVVFMGLFAIYMVFRITAMRRKLKNKNDKSPS